MTAQVLSAIDGNIVPVGHKIPPHDNHSVSVSLPTIDSVKAYEEGVPEFRTSLQGGYPRFVFHACYKELCQRYRSKLTANEDLLVLPSAATAMQCVSFIGRGRTYRTEDGVALAIFPKEDAAKAKSFWQHTGLIVSSRYAEAILAGQKAPAFSTVYQNLRARIADLQETDTSDIYLAPTGMAAIFNTYKAVGASRGTKTIQLGLPYADTLEIQNKFGKDAQYVPYNDPCDLEHLRILVEKGDVSAVFCEIPGNPLLKTIDLCRLKEILSPQGVPLIIDNTLGTWFDVDVSPYADVTVTSLTKYFAGKGNVMGGSVALNRHSPHYFMFKTFFQKSEQLLHPSDAEILLENSMDFGARMEKINANALELCRFLRSHPAVGHVYYTEGDKFYDAIRKKSGGYGGLLSFTLRDPSLMAEVYDHLDVPKGPSLGTNFTLVCPYTLLAHYSELDKVAASRVPADLIRVAVGAENDSEIIARFKKALDRTLTPENASRTYFFPTGVTVLPAAVLS